MRIRSIRNSEQRELGKGSTATTQPAGNSSNGAMSEAEAARYIGMSSGWLKKSRTQRFRSIIDAPPFIRAGAKRVVYRLEDLDAWQERHLEKVGPVRDVSSPDYQESEQMPADSGRPAPKPAQPSREWTAERR